MLFGSKVRKQKNWIISERAYEARDNGYHMFKYICEKREQNVYYAIKECNDKRRLTQFGKTIQFGSYTHCFYYILAECILSTGFDMGFPNSKCGFWIRRVFKFLQPKAKIVFLQHGITKDKLPTIYKNKTNCDLLICGAYPEYCYLRDNFGYDESEVQYTGFARYDNLYKYDVDQYILYMPTWRHWLNEENITDSEYYMTINNFLKSERLEVFLKRTGLKLKFFAHPRIQPFIKSFSVDSSLVQIISQDTNDLQHLMREARIFITDYSSTFFDIAYMKKPIIYYQNDYEKFRQGHYPEGYFSYEQDGFGPVVKTGEDVIKELEKIESNRFVMQDDYTKKVDNFFHYRDQNNCKRIYKAIKFVCENNQTYTQKGKVQEL